MPNQILARKEELLDKKTREKNNNFEEENFKNLIFKILKKKI